MLQERSVALISVVTRAGWLGDLRKRWWQWEGSVCFLLRTFYIVETWQAYATCPTGRKSDAK